MTETVKTPMTLSAAQLKRLQDVHAKQDQNAHALGVCEWEFERERERLMSSPKVDKMRLGALHYEHDQRRAFLLGTIQRTEREQKQIGEELLSEIGIDTKAGHFTIEPRTGRVLKLVNGIWVNADNPLAGAPTP